MDTLGLGLENFDAIGRRRDRDGSKPIDAAGTLPGGITFSGPEELKRVLVSRQREFGRTLTEKMLVYALGRGLERTDRRDVERVVNRLAQHDWRFSTLVQSIVESYPFQYRAAEDP